MKKIVFLLVLCIPLHTYAQNSPQAKTPKNSINSKKTKATTPSPISLDAQSKPAKNEDPFDPCCPPLTEASMVEYFKFVPTGSLNDPYRVVFQEDQNFKNSMQAYIDLLSYTCGATNLHFAWQLCEKGTGSQPANNYCNNVVEKEFFHFVAGGNGVIQNSGYVNTGFFTDNGKECQPNTWYSVVVGMYPDNQLNCFDTRKCSAKTAFDFRFQLQKNSAAPPVVEIRGMGTKPLVREKAANQLKPNKPRN